MQTPAQSRHAQIAIWSILWLINLYASQLFLPFDLAIARSLINTIFLAAFFHTNSELLLQRLFPKYMITYLVISTTIIVALVLTRYTLDRYMFKPFVQPSELLQELIETGLTRIILTTLVTYAMSLVHFRTLTKLSDTKPDIQSPSPTILIKTTPGEHRVECHKIVFIEAMREYIRIHLEDAKPLVTYRRLSDIEQELPNYFLRTHRSNIVNLRKVTSVSSNKIQLNELEAKLSQALRSVFSDKWKVVRI